MKRFTLKVALVLAAGGITCWAQTVVDPLHGCIIGTNCADNGTVTPTIINPLPNFTFTVSPPSSPNNPGDFLVEILVPDNEDPTPSSLSFTIDGTLAGPLDIGTVSGTSTLKGDWKTGGLGAFLGLTLGMGSPPNDISAWLPYTQGNNCGPLQNMPCDPGATGYEVYQVDLGNNLLQGPSNAVKPILTLSGSSLPLASVLAGFLGSGPTFGTSANFISTANSGAIFEAGAPPAPPVPEPSSIILLGSVTLGIATLVKRKTQSRA
jgi:hypothetical protein